MDGTTVLLLSLVFACGIVNGYDSCDEYENCNDCRLAAKCFWCPKGAGGTCMNFYSRRIASLLCSNPAWETHRCAENSDKSRTVNRILDIIVRLEKLKGTKEKQLTISPPTQQPKTTATSTEETLVPDMNAEQLLNKLASLKAYLRDKQQEEETKVASELEQNPVATTDEIKTTPEGKTMSLEEELSKDLENFSNSVVTKQPETTTTSATSEVSTSTDRETTTAEISTQLPQTISVGKPSVVSKGNTDWEQEWHEEVSKPDENSVEVKTSGCTIITKELACNVELNCSWCHTSDQCVGRNEVELKQCFHNDKRVVEKDFGVDPCMHHVSCGTCTNTKGKCYWCEHTKSCHIYPFFGFVPHTCPTNHWYYKQCNVQFALLLFMFPLLLVLISMLVFYFCLRYCFYRKRLVKVPLFEKVPGSIYEKKRGKKIYFMSGEEDEDSRTEKIRKKYQLPLEKEPLIAP